MKGFVSVVEIMLKFPVNAQVWLPRVWAAIYERLGVTKHKKEGLIQRVEEVFAKLAARVLDFFKGKCKVSAPETALQGIATLESLCRCDGKASERCHGVYEFLQAAFDASRVVEGNGTLLSETGLCFLRRQSRDLKTELEVKVEVGVETEAETEVEVKVDVETEAET